MEPFSPETEDSTQTYAALTARHFGADARYLCRSGRGIVTDCDGLPCPAGCPLVFRNFPDPSHALGLYILAARRAGRQYGDKRP